MRQLLIDCIVLAALAALLFAGLRAFGAEPPPMPPPGGPAAPTITLDAPKSVAAGSGYFKVKATAPGPVAFDVEAQFEDPDAAFESEQLDATTYLIGVPASAGVIRITAAASVANGPPVFAKAFIQVTAPEKKKPPVPSPTTGPAPAKVGKLFAVIVADAATPAGQVAADPKLAEALKAGSDVLSVVAPNSPAVASQGLTKFVADAGGAPAIILMDDAGSVYQAVHMPATVADVLSLIAAVHQGK